MEQGKEIQIYVVPVLVLDMDGTVRRTKSGDPFIKNIDDIELMPGIEDIMWKYRNAGFLIAGVSNQGGVAHGHKRAQTVMEEFDRTYKLFKKNPFHTLRSCFNDNSGKMFPYNLRSLCRKPEIGMLALIETDMQQRGMVADWDNSIFVGDRDEDRKCADRAGVKFHHIDEFLSMEHKIGKNPE